MNFFRFILGLGYTFLCGFCVLGLFSFIKESTDIFADGLYILLFVGSALLLGLAAMCSFKQSMIEDSSSEDMPVEDMLIQRKKNNENDILRSSTIDEFNDK